MAYRHVTHLTVRTVTPEPAFRSVECHLKKKSNRIGLANLDLVGGKGGVLAVGVGRHEAPSRLCGG